MTLGIAILGTGRIAENAFAPAVKAVAGARLVAVLSRDEARGAVFAGKHDIAGIYTDLDRLLRDPRVDAVIVATPDVLHEPQVIAAARAGKHVLCEKPMATTLAGCERMAEAVDEAGVTFAMGFNNRFNSGLGRIKEMLDGGTIGAVRYAHVLLTTPQRDPQGWRAKPETARYWAMSASGTHVIDIYRWFFGDPARVGGGLLAPVHKGANDEISTLVFDYPGRLLAEMTVAAILPRGGNRLELHGEDGVIVGEDVFGPRAKQNISLNGEPVCVEWTDPFIGEVSEFVAAIAEKRPPRVTIEDGVKNLRIMERAREGPLLLPL